MALVEIPEKLDFLFEPSRYKVAHGGRGGAKSWAFARALLVLGMTKSLRILCARELQVSIADSVHKLLSDQIEQLGFAGFYEVQSNAIYGKNGTEFIFSGIRSNITKIKSMEGIDVCWVEEAEKVSKDSWDVLIPTIRKPDSEIWVSFNPHEEADPTYERFVKTKPPGAKVVEINWQENPWFPKVLRAEKDYAYSVDPDAAAHVWEGKTRKLSTAQVLRGRCVVEPFEPKAHWGGPYYGADWGFAQDPTTLIRSWVQPAVIAKGGAIVAGPELYVEWEAYKVGCDIDDTPELFDSVPEAKKHVIRADNARPETISFMQRHGYPRCEGVEKWPGSVEDGVEHLRSYKRIVIHPRCKHTAEEARLWSFKVDRLTGDVLPVLIDKHDHCWDGTRYALTPLIKRASRAPKLSIAFAT